MEVVYFVILHDWFVSSLVNLLQLNSQTPILEPIYHLQNCTLPTQNCQSAPYSTSNVTSSVSNEFKLFEVNTRRTSLLRTSVNSESLNSAPLTELKAKSLSIVVRGEDRTRDLRIPPFGNCRYETYTLTD
ncbi:hypothetical protein PROFUN_09097 [Planoprotostelium fungivorum]|uniref:Uncharacterized protein n=1 Tax=Planoprotostelium fungivorum TaxID=1890364 RepID=A0A2P6NHW4_9EUKA|nr:hypothetical protein PROFUN_09097 [Planoprotostelium fungivorum]